MSCIRIEPDWNVKKTGRLVDINPDQIRIEPDWNVKPYKTTFFRTGYGN